MQPVVAGDEVMGRAGTGRSRDDMSRPQFVLLALRAVLRPSRRRPQVQRRRALEDDEDFLLFGVAVGDGAHLPRGELLPRESGELRRRRSPPTSGCPRARASTSSTFRMFSGAASARRPRAAGRRPRRPTGRRPVLRPTDSPCGSRVTEEASASSTGCRVPYTRYSRPSGPATNGVLEVVGRVDDAVARAHLVHVAVLPREARAGEDEVHLLGGAV